MKKAALILALCLLAEGSGLRTQARTGPIQKPIDQEKLYAEIAGEYEFVSASVPETLIVKFFVVLGELYGAPPGEEPEVLNPVKGQPLRFEVVVGGGDASFSLEFVRNDRGEIDKCILKTEGIEAVGKKIKRG
jgi:hypothetical protein